MGKNFKNTIKIFIIWWSARLYWTLFCFRRTSRIYLSKTK